MTWNVYLLHFCLFKHNKKNLTRMFLEPNSWSFRASPIYRWLQQDTWGNTKGKDRAGSGKGPVSGSRDAAGNLRHGLSFLRTTRIPKHSPVTPKSTFNREGLRRPPTEHHCMPPLLREDWDNTKPVLNFRAKENGPRPCQRGTCEGQRATSLFLKSTPVWSVAGSFVLMCPKKVPGQD